MKKQSIGLTLSGGGSRGYVHIGVLKALEERNIKPDIVSGTSMGAIIGALIANGYSSKQIEDWAESLKRKSIFHIRGLHLGLSPHKHVRKILEQLLPPTFEALKLPLYISATSLERGTHKVFSSGPLIDAILASISIPLIFKPVTIEGERYVDGGLVKNLPASTIRDKCDFLIGSNVNHLAQSFETEKTMHLFDRCVRIMIANTLVDEVDKCDLFIDPHNDAMWNMLDFSKVNEVVELGYRVARRALENSYIDE
ncbi:MAG: patatin-like phospholipase family protein [Bacteroidota bacterium]